MFLYFNKMCEPEQQQNENLTTYGNNCWGNGKVFPVLGRSFSMR